MVRALASQQCASGWIPRLCIICGLSLLVLYSAPRCFSLCCTTLVFPSHQKPLLWFDMYFDILINQIKLKADLISFLHDPTIYSDSFKHYHLKIKFYYYYYELTSLFTLGDKLKCCWPRKFRGTLILSKFYLFFKISWTKMLFCSWFSSSWIRSDEGLTLEMSAFRISVRWSIYIYLSTLLIKPNFCIPLPHRRSTTVSLETTHFSS